MQVVGIDFLQYVVIPYGIGGSPLAAGFKLVAVKIPLPNTVATGSTYKETGAAKVPLRGRSWAEVVVNHISTVVAIAADVVLATIDAVGFTPVVDDVVHELIVYMTVMGTGTNTVEAWRTVVAAGKQTVVQGAMLSAPLGSIGTGSLRIAGVIESFREDTPLDGGIVAVVHGQVLFHRPGKSTVVEYDVLHILHIQL